MAGPALLPNKHIGPSAQGSQLPVLSREIFAGGEPLWGISAAKVEVQLCSSVSYQCLVLLEVEIFNISYK